DRGGPGDRLQPVRGHIRGRDRDHHLLHHRQILFAGLRLRRTDPGRHFRTPRLARLSKIIVGRRGRVFRAGRPAFPEERNGPDMGRSWRIGTAFGIGLYVHWSFLLAPALVFMNYWGSGLDTALLMLAVILAVFGCVLLHELGHALMARRFGIN